MNKKRLLKKAAIAVLLAIAAIFIVVILTTIVSAAEKYNLNPTFERETYIKYQEKQKPDFLKSADDKEIFLGVEWDTWHKVFYCAGCAAAAYGAKSGNKNLLAVGGVMLAINIPIDYLYSPQKISWGDIGTGILCGTAGYLLAPKKKPAPVSNNPPSSSPPPSSPPSGSPGPDPTTGGGNPNGSGNGSGSDPGL